MKDIFIQITHTVNIGDYIVYNPETGLHRILTDAVRQTAPKAPEMPPAPVLVQPDEDGGKVVDIFSKGPQGRSLRRSLITTLISGTNEEFTAGQIGRALVQGMPPISAHAWSRFNATIHHELGALEEAGCVERIKRPNQHIHFKFLKLPEIPL